MVELFHLADEENNQQIIVEVTKKILELKSKVKKNEIKCFLSTENDRLDCFWKFMQVLVVQKVKIGLKC